MGWQEGSGGRTGMQVHDDTTNTGQQPTIAAADVHVAFGTRHDLECEADRAKHVFQPAWAHSGQTAGKTGAVEGSHRVFPLMGADSAFTAGEPMWWLTGFAKG